MNKLIDFGRKALFYARVLSGYEERRIRTFRLQLENRIKQAQEKRAAARKLPEQVIISEVRRMVEEMQALNKKLEDTEAAIEDYFKPLDKQAEMIMETQLEGEEKTMKEMMKAMQKQALLEKEEMEILPGPNQAEESNQPKQISDEGRAAEMMKAMQKQALLEKEEMEILPRPNQAEESNQPKHISDEGRAANS